MGVPLVELDGDVLTETSERLHRRIGERFPGSGLERRGAELTELIVRLRARAVAITEPIWWIRWLYAALALIVTIGVAAAPIEVSEPIEMSLVGWVQFVQAAVNDLILAGAGLAFLSTLDTRIKRGRALKELHEIRSFAHVIDMMQLTKDPQRLASTAGRNTASSPKSTMDAYDLGRYLDYCSELLSLSAKGAAMIAQRFDDPAVLAAVNEIETLTSGLSRKIWQKLMVLMATNPEAAPTSALRPPARSEPPDADGLPPVLT